MIYFIEDVRAIVLSDFIVIWLVILFIWSSLHHGSYHMFLIICLTFFLVYLSPRKEKSEKNDNACFLSEACVIVFLILVSTRRRTEQERTNTRPVDLHWPFVAIWIKVLEKLGRTLIKRSVRHILFWYVRWSFVGLSVALWTKVLENNACLCSEACVIVCFIFSSRAVEQTKKSARQILT